MLILTIVGSHAVNKMLGGVKCLTVITHFMMMALNYPPVVSEYFSNLFEFSNFDIIPTEYIYKYLFGWKNIAYS